MEIKGDRRGLRLIAEGFESDAALIDDLRRTLHDRAAFLGRAELLVEVDRLPLTGGLFQQIADVFQDFPNLQLRGVHQRDASNGLIPWDGREKAGERLNAPPKVVRQTLRSGQRLVHAGDVIIVGDVNPGATVIAGGDVMVFGWLRGIVHAGQPDDVSRGVFALRFDPAQIRIGPILAIGDSESRGEPEQAVVEEGQVVVRPWTDVRLPDIVTHAPTAWRSSTATPS
ncbi:MAG: septum site-determining protein MinC [Sulfobacillus sp.]|nr:septum site-determining protein MinC [Sulfobacillus sp.]